MPSIATLHSLNTIYKKTKDWLQEKPIENDLMHQQVVLNGWLYVNTAYPLLEQSLKALMMERDQTYEPTKDSHSLKAVFFRLAKPDQDRIRKGYVAFQSLHDYVGYRTLDEFIDNIDNDYAKWRYYPLEGWKKGQPATTSVEAMLEVARQTLDIFAALVATDHGYRSVGDRLEQKIRYALGRNQTHFDYEDGMGRVEALNAWVKENDGLFLNGVAKMVWHEQRKGTPVPYQFTAPLSDMMETLMKTLLQVHDGDIRQFLYRAREADRPLVWDRQNGVFQ